MSAPWGFFLLVVIFFGAMFGSMFVAWLVGRAVVLADGHAARHAEAGDGR